MVGDGICIWTRPTVRQIYSRPGINLSSRKSWSQSDSCLGGGEMMFRIANSAALKGGRKKAAHSQRSPRNNHSIMETSMRKLPHFAAVFALAVFTGVMLIKGFVSAATLRHRRSRRPFRSSRSSAFGRVVQQCITRLEHAKQPQYDKQTERDAQKPQNDRHFRLLVSLKSQQAG